MVLTICCARATTLRASPVPQSLSRRSPPLASPPSLTRSGAEPRGRERDFCPRQRAGHCADTPGSPRAATGRSRGPLRAECGLRSGRRERLSLLRAFHALLCVPKHTLRSSVASPGQLACHCHCPRRPLTVAALYRFLHRPRHLRPSPTQRRPMPPLLPPSSSRPTEHLHHLLTLSSTPHTQEHDTHYFVQATAKFLVRPKE